MYMHCALLYHVWSWSCCIAISLFCLNHEICSIIVLLEKLKCIVWLIVAMSACLHVLGHVFVVSILPEACYLSWTICTCLELCWSILAVLHFKTASTLLTLWNCLIHLCLLLMLHSPHHTCLYHPWTLQLHFLLICALVGFVTPYPFHFSPCSVKFVTLARCNDTDFART